MTFGGALGIQFLNSLRSTFQRICPYLASFLCWRARWPNAYLAFPACGPHCLHLWRASVGLKIDLQLALHVFHNHEEIWSIMYALCARARIWIASNCAIPPLSICLQFLQERVAVLNAAETPFHLPLLVHSLAIPLWELVEHVALYLTPSRFVPTELCSTCLSSSFASRFSAPIERSSLGPVATTQRVIPLSTHSLTIGDVGSTFS